MLNKIFRKPYRELLAKLTAQTLHKHKPNVIVVMGDGQTSIGRELVYHMIKSKFPARRNLESPEAEFSVPLTVLGYPNYPEKHWEWVWILIKSFFLIKKNPPHKHFLILELNFIDSEILSYWLKVIAPETTLIVGKVPLDYSEFSIKKVVKISNTHPEEVLKPFEMAAQQIGRYYKLSSEEIDNAIKTFSLPSSKIRFFPGINNSIIIDATHYYFPIKLNSVLELVINDTDVGQKIIFTDNKKDIKLLKKHSGWEINPGNYTPKDNDVIVLRGNKLKNMHKFEYLFASKMPLI